MHLLLIIPFVLDQISQNKSKWMNSWKAHEKKQRYKMLYEIKTSIYFSPFVVLYGPVDQSWAAAPVAQSSTVLFTGTEAARLNTSPTTNVSPANCSGHSSHSKHGNIPVFLTRFLTTGDRVRLLPCYKCFHVSYAQ